MIRNYLKIALRSMYKQKLYTLINLLSLSVGIGCTALILLFVQDELSFDDFHEKKDHIFRISRMGYAPDGSLLNTDTRQPMPLGPAMKADLPEVVRYARLRPSSTYVRRGEQLFQEDILYADPDLMRMFTFPLAAGQIPTGLDDILISESLAEKYFDSEAVTGEYLSFWIDSAYQEFRIGGVVQDIPSHSSVHFDILIPFEKLPVLFESERRNKDEWQASGYITYVELSPGTSAADFQAKMSGLRKKYFPEEEAELRNAGRWEGSGPPYSYLAQPLTDIHMNPGISSGLTAPSNPLYSYVLGGIALCLLLIACINFMTLAIGRSASRIKEIGIRKVIGASRKQLIFQFGAEALIISLVALVLGLSLAEALLPLFRQLAEKSLDASRLFSPLFFGSMLGIALLTGLLAGSYPALVLSRFRPVEAFQKSHKLGGANLFTRSLVVVQFSMAIFLLLGGLVMARQLSYMKSRYLGFDKEQIIVISTQQVDGDRILEQYRQLATRNPYIEQVGASTISFSRSRARVGFEQEGKVYEPDFFRIDHNYLSTLGLELVAGRNFDPQLATDTADAILINESMARLLNWKNPVGKRLEGFGRHRSGMVNPVIVGVVKDFNFRSLEFPVDAAILSLEPSNPYRYVLVRTRPENLSSSLSSLEDVWDEMKTGLPFNYSFLDDDMARLYESEERWSAIVTYASVLTILLAAMGLFGLSALTLAGRTKEIGIRKVLGASGRHLFFLLSKGLGRLVLIGFALAIPLSWLMMNYWLTQFAYRIQIGPGLYLGAAVMIGAILFLSVSYNAIRATLTDPVLALRDD